MTDILKAINLERTFPTGFQLGPLSFSIVGGQTIGIVGHNGAGKTTLFELITGNIYASSGSVELDGRQLSPDRSDLKQEIGYLPQNLRFPAWITAFELIDYASRLQNINNRRSVINEALSYWKCEPYAMRPLASCSHGMQKRAALALATFHKPKLLILDEPFSGLDISHIRALTDLIAVRQKQGMVTVISTHMSLYVAKLCDRTFLLHGGQIEDLTQWSHWPLEKRADQLEEYFFHNQASSI